MTAGNSRDPTITSVSKVVVRLTDVEGKRSRSGWEPMNCRTKLVRFLVDDHPPDMVTRPHGVTPDRVVSDPEMRGTHPRHNKRLVALQHALSALRFRAVEF